MVKGVVCMGRSACGLVRRPICRRSIVWGNWDGSMKPEMVCVTSPDRLVSGDIAREHCPAFMSVGPWPRFKQIDSDCRETCLLDSSEFWALGRMLSSRILVWNWECCVDLKQFLQQLPIIFENAHHHHHHCHCSISFVIVRLSVLVIHDGEPDNVCVHSVLVYACVENMKYPVCKTKNLWIVYSCMRTSMKQTVCVRIVFMYTCAWKTGYAHRVFHVLMH